LKGCFLRRKYKAPSSSCRVNFHDAAVAATATTTAAMTMDFRADKLYHLRLQYYGRASVRKNRVASRDTRKLALASPRSLSASCRVQRPQRDALRALYIRMYIRIARAAILLLSTLCCLHLVIAVAAAERAKSIRLTVKTAEAQHFAHHRIITEEERERERETLTIFPAKSAMCIPSLLYAPPHVRRIFVYQSNNEK
ncbi:unnamed protein product, partial [Trichogramma brassicae]